MLNPEVLKIEYYTGWFSLPSHPLASGCSRAFHKVHHTADLHRSLFPPSPHLSPAHCKRYQSSEVTTTYASLRTQPVKSRLRSFGHAGARAHKLFWGGRYMQAMWSHGTALTTQRQVTYLSLLLLTID